MIEVWESVTVSMPSGSKWPGFAEMSRENPIKRIASKPRD